MLDKTIYERFADSLPNHDDDIDQRIADKLAAEDTMRDTHVRPPLGGNKPDTTKSEKDRTESGATCTTPDEPQQE